MFDDHRLSRRDFLSTTGRGALVVAVGAVIAPPEAWGLQVEHLGPATMKTLIRIARDIYPHDRLPDRHYANAVKTYDRQAGTDPELKTLIEAGVAGIDDMALGRYGGAYVQIALEERRVAVLNEATSDALLVKLRGDLRISLYNDPAVWPIFGYEGESFSRGGYLHRGFDDIEWL
jgi:hypothetical protein